jgi:hypothetical protein
MGIHPKLGLREDGTIHDPVADRRLHGATRVDGFLIRLNEPGAVSPQRVPIVGRCFRSSPIQKFAGLIVDPYCRESSVRERRRKIVPITGVS